jgi:hypothetical protein
MQITSPMKLPVICLLASATALYAAEKTEEPTFLEPAAAGHDYADQGEYKNDWGGAQVIALGNGAFQMVTYPGGLPGNGWNHENKRESSGKREGDKVVFTATSG